MKRLTATSTFTLAIGLAACAPSTPPRWLTAVTETRDFAPDMLNGVAARAPNMTQAYAKDSDVQTGELWVPKGRGPFPVAYVVHGGCFDAAIGKNGKRGLWPLNAWLADHGVAVWSIDYRQLGDGGGWPMTFNDWAGGFAHLRTLAKRYPLDLGKVSVIGHSAGAPSVMWLASGHGDADIVAGQLPDVRSGVVLDGPIGLKEFGGVDAQVCGKPVIAPLMGGTPAKVPSRYEMLDVSKNPPRVRSALVVLGSLPPQIPATMAALKAQGIAVEQITVPTGSHFNMLVPGTSDFAAIAPALLKATGGR